MIVSNPKHHSTVASQASQSTGSSSSVPCTAAQGISTANPHVWAAFSEIPDIAMNRNRNLKIL